MNRRQGFRDSSITNDRSLSSTGQRRRGRFSRDRPARKSSLFPRLLVELLENRMLLAAGDVILSELMAETGGTIQDGNGNGSDWLEIHNGGNESIDLAGWHLTDDETNLRKWTFPGYDLAADERLLVFATGDDNVDAGGYLHTNFQLNVAGEYVALVRPDGETINTEFSPAFPALAEDVSHGQGTLAPFTLISKSDSARHHVPPSDSLGATWTAPMFDDSGWTETAASVGYDTTSVNGLIKHWDFETGDLQDFRITHGSSFNSQPTYGDNPNARGWPAIGVNGDYFIGTYENRPTPEHVAGATQGDGPTGIAETAPFVLTKEARFDFLIGGGNHPWNGGWDPDTVWGVGDFTGINFERQIGPDDWEVVFTATGANSEVMTARSWDVGPYAGQTVRLRLYDLHSGGWGHANFDDIRYVGLANDFATDIETDMHDENASSFLRIPFAASDSPQHDILELDVTYNDGFVAYLNGTEVARRNISSTTWNASADGASESSEVIDISQHVGLLDADGANVLAIHGQNVAADDNNYMLQAELNLRSSVRLPRFFIEPTPGLPNGVGVAGLVDDTSFDVDRGFFGDPFDVTISTLTPDATIRYTIDGSEPTATHGQIFTAPISISTTTTLRASAFIDDFAPSNVDTQTYILLEAVIRQPSDPHGVPPDWNNYLIGGRTGQPVPADYAMSQTIVDQHADTIIDDLKSIPTLSVVMDNDDLFGTDNGIYVNPFMSGEQREKTVSIEWIDPDGESFQLGAGLRIAGGWSRHFWATPKKTFTLRFRRDHGGPPKLQFDLFGQNQADSAVVATDEFETVMLRGVFSDAWPDAASAPQYLRDLNARYMQLAMGQQSSHGTWVHLYLNGLYWGIYNPSERPDADFSAAYGGGETTEYEAVKHAGLCGPGCAVNNQFEVIDGDGSYFQQALNLAASGLANANNYEQFKQIVDVENLADYILLEEYIGNVDWPHKNWYANKKEGEGYKFYVWDSEYTLRDINANRLSVNNANTPAFLYSAARQNPDFRRVFGDRVHKHLFNDGAIQPEQNIARYSALADHIDGAIKAEAARWGDNGDTRKGGTNFTYAGNWVPVKNDILNNFFPQRHNIALGHYRSAGLYPNLAAASYNQHGGQIPAGFELTMLAPSGTIYYTLDGSDPWDDGVAAGAIEYTGPLIIDESAVVKSRVVSPGNQWSALNEATFAVDAPSPIRVSEVMYNPLGSDDTEYIQIQNIGNESVQLDGFRFSDGIDFVFPEMELGAGEHVVVVRDQVAFETKYTDPTIVVAGQFNSGQLSNNGERITLLDPFGLTVQEFQYNDAWYPITDGGGFSLVAVDTTAAASSFDEREAWRPSSSPDGSPGSADDYSGPLPGDVAINELMTHTDDATGDWIELRNNTNQDVDIENWYLSDDPSDATKLRINQSTVIPAGGFLVLTEQQVFGLAVDPANGFGLSELGDEVSLAAGVAGGSLAGFQVVRDFGAAENGVTIGTYTNSVGNVDFVSLSAPTAGTENSEPLVGPVVINEIMYHPIDDETEFIELHNITGAALPLFDPANPGNTWTVQGGVDYVFETGTEIPANGYLMVVAGDPEQYRQDHQLPAQLPIFGPFSGSLNNGGESVRIFKPGVPELDGTVPEIRVDRISYDNRVPWPVEAAGLGASIERVDSSLYGNDPAHWMRGSFGGSPGILNAGIDISVPSAPVLRTGIATGSNQVALQWQASEDPESGIGLYQVYRDGQWIGETDENQFTDENYDPETTVLYSVTAMNRDGLAGPRSGFHLVSSVRDGTDDAQLSEQSPDSNAGSAVTLKVDNDDPDGSNQHSVALMRWDVTNIPSGATVSAASLTVNLTVPSSHEYEVYAILRPWVEGEANWNELADGQAWESPGADGPLDRGDTLIGKIENVAAGSRTIQLTEAGRDLVQSWIDGSAENNGVAIVPSGEATPGGPSEVLEDLIAFYDFESTAGGQAEDVSGNNRNGAIEGFVDLDDGFDGSGYRFNGASHVDAPININPSALPRFTMGAWVKSDSVSSGLYKVLGHDNGGWDRTVGLDNRGTGGFRWSAFIGNGTPVASTPPPVFDQWAFLAAVYDQPSGNVTLYVDIDADTANDDLRAFSNPTGFGSGQTSVAIGSLRPDNFSEGFRGVMDNVFFFSDALSQQDLTQLRDLGVSYFQSDGVELSSSESSIAANRPRINVGYTLPFTVVSVAANQHLTDPPNRDQGPQPTSWAEQASDLRGIRVTFTEDVVVAAADLALVNLGVNAPVDADVVIPLSDDQLSVNGNGLDILFEADELADGVYQITFRGTVTDTSGAALDANGDGVPGDALTVNGSPTNGLHQAAGDFNGDGSISIFDFPTFAYWFSLAAGPEGPAPLYADLNRDGGVTIFDFPIFAANFGGGVVFPPAVLTSHRERWTPLPTSLDAQERQMSERDRVFHETILPDVVPLRWFHDQRRNRREQQQQSPRKLLDESLEIALNDFAKQTAHHWRGLHENRLS